MRLLGVAVYACMAVYGHIVGAHCMRPRAIANRPYETTVVMRKRDGHTMARCCGVCGWFARLCCRGALHAPAGDYKSPLRDAVLRAITNRPYVTRCMRAITNRPYEDAVILARFIKFNIGNNEPIELSRFIEAIESAVGKKAEKIMLGMQHGDVERTTD